MNEKDLVKEIDSAKAAHSAWVRRFTHDIKTGHAPLSPGATDTSGNCSFGTWLDGEGLADSVRKTEPYSLVRWLHDEVHALAREVVALRRDGRDFEARRLLTGDFASVSTVLGHTLEAWQLDLSGEGPVALFGS